jgi:tetratricopeptide (TPR) repeat protein
LKDLNKEQILFIFALVLLGVLAYFRFGDQVKSKRTPRGKVGLELPALEPCANPQFADASLEFYSGEGRNIFAPPRDWLPLEPLLLDLPPFTELLAVGPFTRPGLAEEFYSAYYYLPEAGAEEGGMVEEGTEEEAPVEEAAAPQGLKVDLESVEEEEDLEARYMAQYDWLRVDGQVSRLFGRILNQDKYALLKNSEPIEFEQVSVRTGRPLGSFEYGRERVDDFGFADTVVNRIELMLTELSLHAGNLPAIHEKALWCLSLRHEDIRAVDYAVDLLNKAIELDPLSKESYRLLADIHRATFNTEEELKILQKAIDERQLKAPGVHVRYGRLLRRYRMDDEALEAYQEAENIEPGNAEALVARADLSYDHGDYEEALNLYQQAERSRSWKAELKMAVLLGEGRCLLALNRLDPAAGKVQRAVNLDEEDGDAWCLKGAIALAQGDTTAADESLRRASALDPERGDYVMNLGVALFRAGDLEGALRKFDEAIVMDPFNSHRPTAAKGFIREILNEDEQATSLYEKGVAIDPEDFYALYLCGRDLRRHGDMEDSIGTLKTALQINDRMKEILSELGLSCLLAGKYEDASFYFEEFLKRGKGDFRLLYLYGLALLNQNRLDESINRFSEAVSQAENNPDPYNGMAYALYAQSRVEEALDAFGKVVRLFEEGSSDPRYEYAQRWMARIEEHRRKSQWLDGFERKDLGNDWEEVMRAGPRIRLVNNRIMIAGDQRQEQPDERTELRRVLPGKAFRVFEADVIPEEGNQARIGIFVGLYIPRGVQGMLTQAEISLALEPNGSLVYNVVDKGKEGVEWTRIGSERFPSGTPVRLGIEVLDYDEGRIRLTVDGEAALPEDLVVKKMKKATRDLRLGVFAAAPGSRSVNMTADNVRMVITN